MNLDNEIKQYETIPPLQLDDGATIFRHCDYSKSYEKPIIVKLTKMRFPIEIIESTGKGVVCKQCSSCHNCR